MLRQINFNLWYYFYPPWDSGISPPELLEFISKHPAGKAIDLGCGTGTNVITLAQNGWQVTGIDFAPRAIQMAKNKAERAIIKASLFVGDVTRMNAIAGPFNLALDIGCFHGIKSRANYLDLLTHVITNGGFWLMYGFFKSAPEIKGPGLSTIDLDLIQTRGFLMLSRTDGYDKHGRASAWFLFSKP